MKPRERLLMAGYGRVRTERDALRTEVARLRERVKVLIERLAEEHERLMRWGVKR